MAIMAESHSAKKKRSLIHNYFVEVDGAVTIKKNCTADE